jgi:ABC-type sugar transport system substrate-binding protein
MSRRSVQAALGSCAVVALAVLGATASRSPAAHQKRFTVAFSNYAAVIPFYRSMIAGARAGAKRYGWKLVVTDSGFDPAKQTSQIGDDITKHVDLIIASPGDQNALVPAYRDAKRAGIPVMSVANHIAPKEQKALELTFYGRNWAEVASIRTKYLAKRLGGKGDIILIRGPSGVAFVEEEKQGLFATLKSYPQIHVVFDQNAKQFSASEGLRLAEDALTAHPNAKAIWTEGDDLAQGIVRALKERNNHMIVVGSDGAPAAFNLVLKGQMTAMLALPTYQWGLDFMRIAHDFLVNGKRPAHLVKAPIVIVTQANARQILAKTCPKIPQEIYCQGRK